jgi:hypothetical protein
MSHHHRTRHLVRAGRIGFGLVEGILLLAIGAAGGHRQDAARPQLDVTKDGTHQSGPWTYEYATRLKGTRSEGYYGKLSYEGREVPEPANLNDYYETPWGRIYWVGQSVMLFGVHGWMPNPVAREPEGQALTDPGKLAGQAFSVRVKVLTPEELGTPIESRPIRVLEALKSFDLKRLTAWGRFDGVRELDTLHDTNRWGHFEMSMAQPDPRRHWRGVSHTGDFTITTSRQMNSMAALIPPDRSGDSEFIALPPQINTVRAIQCKLTPVVGDALDLFLVCQVEGSR